MDTIVPLSNASQQNNPEVTAYHEAGHAVMARLLGRSISKVSLVLNVEQSYNGSVCWDREDVYRPDWDSNLPYEELKLQQRDPDSGVALVFAAGKAAERIWYRQRTLDETWASYGQSGGEFNDERELEKELRRKFPRMRPEKLPQAKQIIEDLAVRLLVFPTCWQAVEAVAQELLERLKQNREYCTFEETQDLIAEVFRSGKNGIITARPWNYSS